MKWIIIAGIGLFAWSALGDDCGCGGETGGCVNGVFGGVIDGVTLTAQQMLDYLSGKCVCDGCGYPLPIAPIRPH